MEFTDLLVSGNRGTTSQEVLLGKIYICNVDGPDLEGIKGILEKVHASYTGAMGTNAKIMAEQARIPLDFTYGVIDKCILKALTGKNSLIMTSGGMVDHSVKRIRVYCEESGANIEVIKLAQPAESSMNSDMQKVLSQKESTTLIEVAQ